VETLILVTIVLSFPGYIWRSALGRSGYKIKTISTLIAATKQTTGTQRESNISQLANHIKTARRYHRLHWTFDQDLRRRLAHLRLVLNIILIRL
jgi:hypothetical protein